MQRLGTGCHVKQAERAIRTVKDKCRATKFSLGWTLPRSLHQHLIVNVVKSMNDTVNFNRALSTPNILELQVPLSHSLRNLLHRKDSSSS